MLLGARGSYGMRNVSLLVILLFIFSCKTQQQRPTTTVKFIREDSTSITLRLWDVGINKEEISSNAQREALKIILFRGVPESQQKSPLISFSNNKNTNKIQQQYCDSFFAKNGKCDSFVVSCHATTKKRKIAKRKEAKNLFPLVIGGVRVPFLGSHRGLHKEFPENTMPAFEAAIKKGYHYIETDVVQSSDSVQFILHDANINRTSNGRGEISKLTAKQITSYNYGYSKKFGSKFDSIPIPTLEEFLIFCKTNNCIAELDLADDRRYKNNYLQNTYDIVKRTDMLDNVFFCAPLTRIEALLAIDSTVMVSVSDMTSTKAMDNAIEKIRHSRWATFSCPHNSITQSLINHAHSLGIPLKIWYNEWDGNDTFLQIDKLFNQGVAIALTDHVLPQDSLITSDKKGKTKRLFQQMLDITVDITALKKICKATK